MPVNRATYLMTLIFVSNVSLLASAHFKLPLIRLGQKKEQFVQHVV